MCVSQFYIATYFLHNYVTACMQHIIKRLRYNYNYNSA